MVFPPLVSFLAVSLRQARGTGNPRPARFFLAFADAKAHKGANRADLPRATRRPAA
jgi:hypothetical protein